MIVNSFTGRGEALRHSLQPDRVAANVKSSLSPALGEEEEGAVWGEEGHGLRVVQNDSCQPTWCVTWFRIDRFVWVCVLWCLLILRRESVIADGNHS